jgi:ABC-2 type transport system permease protein
MGAGASTVRYLAASIATNLRAAYALRASFWLQVALMLANNVLFFTTWWIFFGNFRDLAGWRRGDVQALYGIVAGAYGLACVVCGGHRTIAAAVEGGELDVYLVRPRAPLPALLTSRTVAAGLGDLVTAALFLATSDLVTGRNAPLALGAILTGAAVFLGAAVMLHALALWGATNNALARMLSDYIVIMSSYPQSAYDGLLRVAMFTVLPAGFIGFLPVTCLREPSAGLVAATVAGAVAFPVGAAAMFRRGLRRYASGSRLSAGL